MVKSIMNQAYQSMATKLKDKEQFERTEVLSLLLSTIKVYSVWCELGWVGGREREGASEGMSE